MVVIATSPERLQNTTATTSTHLPSYRPVSQIRDHRDLPTDLPTDRKVPVPTKYSLPHRCTCTFTYREGFGICSVG
eukprot:COSAG02_NODE_1538_length_12042_cov_323.842083_12_plen_76_part_00